MNPTPEKVLDHRASTRRGRTGPLRLLAVVALLGGVSVIGYGAWQYWGTNIVSKQHHAEIRERVETDWANGHDGDAVALLRVERFGEDFEVPIVSGFDDDALARGVGMYEDSAAPGEVGNFAIAGHRVTHGEPFRDFLELRPGDVVEVETRTHVYTYEMGNAGDDLTLDFTEGWPLQPVPDPELRGEHATEPVITMLTCSELFHTRDRNIVFGTLVDAVPKPAS